MAPNIIPQNKTEGLIILAPNFLIPAAPAAAIAESGKRNREFGYYCRLPEPPVPFPGMIFGRESHSFKFRKPCRIPFPFCIVRVRVLKRANLYLAERIMIISTKLTQLAAKVQISPGRSKGPSGVVRYYRIDASNRLWNFPHPTTESFLAPPIIGYSN